MGKKLFCAKSMTTLGDLTVIYYYGASRVLNLLTVCGEIRQTLDAKMRQISRIPTAGLY
jgi:hypothetical protein